LIFSGSVLLTCVKDWKKMKIVVLFCVWVIRCDCVYCVIVHRPILAWHVELEGTVAQHFLFWYKRVKSGVKSRFCAISPDFNDFTWFWPDFTYFRVLWTI
jgi:hypothetical protein